MQGFLYVDWFLSSAERAAWGHVLAPPCDAGRSPLPTPPEGETSPSTALEVCAEAEEWATQSFEWTMTYNNVLLDIASNYLTLARVTLYRALLSPLAYRDSAAMELQSWIASALDRLRQANSLDHLPKALLTAALYHRTLGADPEEARRLLAEAQQIAERGPMPLHLADVYLHRARLFRDRSELARARVLIEKHGYGHRRDELADAQAAFMHW